MEKEVFIKRVREEYESYLDELKKLDTESIINLSFKTATYYDLMSFLEGKVSSIEDNKKLELFSLERPIASIYAEYLKSDDSMEKYDNLIREIF